VKRGAKNGWESGGIRMCLQVYAFKSILRLPLLPQKANISINCRLKFNTACRNYAVLRNLSTKGEMAMATVRDMIRKKGGEVFGINPDATVYDALQLMAKHNVGALLVLQGKEMVGIVSERDCVRKVDLKGRSVQATKVSDIMTSNVITVHCDQPLEECEALMMEKSIRHLPVYDGQELVGLLSVRDVMREMIEIQQMMLSQLERYITGGGR
jgi:CBS domain-containing protein